MFPNDDVRAKISRLSPMHLMPLFRGSTPSLLSMSYTQNIADGDVKYDLTLSAISTDPAYNDVLMEKITAENVDDDFAGLVFSVHGGSSVAVTHEDDSGVPTAAYDVRLSSEPISPVTVTAISEDSSEGSILSSSNPMVFNKDNWKTRQKLELVGEDDVEVDGDIMYSIALSTDSDDPNYSAVNLDPVSLNVINKDDDLAGFTLMVGYDM